MVGWPAQGHSGRSGDQTVQTAGGRLSPLSNTVLGSPEGGRGGTMGMCQRKTSGLQWTWKGRAPSGVVFARNLHKSAKAHTPPQGFPLSREYCISGDPSHYVHCPQALFSNCSALEFHFILYNLVISCPIYFSLHSLDSVWSCQRKDFNWWCMKG